MTTPDTPKLLLTSVFKPFGVDDEFGVKENVCELMHNQVTRGQGVFSIRSHNRSFGLSLIAENLRVPTTVLDFPTREEFVAELKSGGYTHLGISFIVPNVDKARWMAETARRELPKLTIWLGGHGARIPDLGAIVPHDEACPGEGIRWLRERFGEPVEAPIRHPAMAVDCWRKLIGVPAPHRKAILIPGVGCANKCAFCCTSHFFEGYTPFFRDVDALFATMCEIADRLKTREFFVLDENFLDDRTRVDRLLELIKKHDRPFLLDIFSSLRAIAQYDPATLLDLGIRFVWIGIESRRELFDKVKGLDAAAIIKGLQAHGISVLASTILFLDHHDAAGMQEDIDYTIGLAPDFIQFMELAPLPGTALFEKLEGEGRLLHDIPMREWHGQDKIWFAHPHVVRADSKRLLDAAFAEDFERLGPSLLRIAATRIEALDTPIPRIDAWRERRLDEMRTAAAEMRPLLPALTRQAPNPRVRAKAEAVERAFRRQFGAMRLDERLGAAVVSLLARLEARRARLGQSVHQPPTFIDRYRWT